MGSDENDIFSAGALAKVFSQWKGDTMRIAAVLRRLSNYLGSVVQWLNLESDEKLDSSVLEHAAEFGVFPEILEGLITKLETSDFPETQTLSMRDLQDLERIISFLDWFEDPYGENDTGPGTWDFCPSPTVSLQQVMIPISRRLFLHTFEPLIRFIECVETEVDDSVLFDLLISEQNDPSQEMLDEGKVQALAILEELKNLVTSEMISGGEGPSTEFFTKGQSFLPVREWSPEIEESEVDDYETYPEEDDFGSVEFCEYLEALSDDIELIWGCYGECLQATSESREKGFLFN